MSHLFAMLLFSLAMSISPGPVNMIIFSSGVNYGVKRTIPYISGATIGFTLLLLFVGFGLFQFIKAYPFFLSYLTTGGMLYIIYIACKMALASVQNEEMRKNIPTFYQGFLLQWINPKAWIACVSGVSIFSNPQNYNFLLMFTSVYFLVCYMSLFTWAIMGDRISFLLNSHFRLRLFNCAMGSLLIITVCYLYYTHA